MAHYGTLRNFRFSDTDVDDIRGSSVYGREDDKLGKIDDVIFDHSTGDIRYAVVDTGGWLSTKKFLVPADRLRAFSKHDDDFEIDMDRRQVESLPPYNEEDMKSDEKWNDYEGRYRSKWVDGPVMHRAETDRNITPTTAQMTQGTGATGPKNWEAGSERTSMGHGTGSAETSQSAVNAAASRTERVIPPTSNEVTIRSSAAGIGPRWSNFEERLRQRRKEAVLGCNTCIIGSDRKAS
jgi:sporulation protein YlmC with PRC-barrel domain